MTGGHLEHAQQPADQRAVLEERLGGLYHLLRRLEGLQEQKDSVYQRHAHLYRPYKTKWRAKHYWLWALLLSVGLGPVFGLAMVVAGNNSGGGMTPLLLALVASGILVGVRNSRLPEMNAQIEQYNQETSKKIVEMAGPEVTPIESQLQQARQEFNSRYLGWFPEKYLSSVDVGECWQIVHDHRASTVQEAVNRYLTDQHEQYLRDAANAQLAEQQRATRVAQTNGIINAAMQAATIGAIQAQGAATRAAMNAPRTIRIERR
ncbi:hypothetical protein [Arthrobacter bambusae]|uniref:SMODS and SLOG-associating 2TM effector domain-containing protein n=1 Tax=Arthrobacter bambusae TaxID=1338426 RepID=A0AAW8DDG1_9MICC|nr:hypothetical protein [Arthrobacter bambusae]MDP9904543.1 hypothetical protein [Arthrobacter bambusae]MDQ0129358.1 hypothetical protein [Arthrobacter bambusae]MDQ0181029.1 hypothetical protein [Arthrobacter bambusae]